MPKIIIIGHSLFKLLQKCSHMLFFETQCISLNLISDVIKDFVFKDKAKDMGSKDEDKDLQK